MSRGERMSLSAYIPSTWNGAWHTVGTQKAQVKVNTLDKWNLIKDPEMKINFLPKLTSG